MRIAVNGAAGAMGRRVVALAARDERWQLVAALERTGHADLGADAGALAGVGALGVALTDELAGEPEVLIDFSTPGSTVARARQCAERGVALVIGTTGLSAEQAGEIEGDAASRVPVVMAPNMSVGVNLLFRLAEEVAGALAGYDVEIVEAHHRRKVDAPSGTALELGRRVCRALGREPEAALICGREGRGGPRPDGEVAIHAVRGGDVVGEHTVIFAGPGERIELTHRAGSRDVFAAGALRAAAFVAGCSPGLYSMEDVVGEGGRT